MALIGCNHRTAPVELRERVAFTPEQALHAAGELRRRGILDEAVVLSTCNRSELYGVPADAESAVTDAMEDFLTSYHRISRAELDGRIYRWEGTDAVRHLFRVAAGLDSMLLGEAEILGQLRTAYGQALEHGSTGPVLNRAFQGALEVGKRVRAETEVGARPMSVALAGVKLAERVFGNLKGRAALIVGAGAVAEQVVEHLRSRGIGSLRVVNRSHDRAAELAARMGGEAVHGIRLKTFSACPTLSSRPSAVPVPSSRAKCSNARWPLAPAARSSSSTWASRATSLRKPPASTISISTTSTTLAKSSNRTSARAKPKFPAPKPSSPSTWRNSKAGARPSTPARLSTILRGRFRKHREMLLRERLAEMKDVSPEERQRLASITEELIERVLDEPDERLRGGRDMRGRLGAIEALRHLFGLDRESEGGKEGSR